MLDNCSNYCNISDKTRIEINQLLSNYQKIERPKRRILELMLNSTTPKITNSNKSCLINFFHEPVKININENTGRVIGLDLRNKLNKQIVQVSCGLLIYAIGFEHILLNGVPKTNDDK